MNEHLQPMNFGGMVRRTWGLTLATAARIGPIMLIYHLLLMFMVWWIIDGIFTLLPQLITESQRTPNGQLDPDTALNLILPIYGRMILATPLNLLAQILSPWLQTMTVYASWGEVNGEHPGLGGLMRRPFKRALWMVIAHMLIIGGIASLGSMVLVPFVAVGTAVVLPLGIAAGFGFFLALLYFIVAASLSVHFIALDDRGPWKGLIASITLVKNDWWRAFSLLAIIWCVVAVIAAPAGIWMVLNVIDVVRTLGIVSNPEDPAVAAEFFAQIGRMLSPWMFVIYGVASSAFSLLMINAQTVLFVDLRARRGDFLGGDEMGEEIAGNL